MGGRKSGMLISRVKEMRQKLGWTQTALAEFCGVTIATLRHAEQGNTKLIIDTYQRIANGLGVSVLAILPTFEFGPKKQMQSSPRNGRPSPLYVRNVRKVR